MERKYVVQCSIAFLLFLLQADVIDSRGSRGGSRSGSSKINFWGSSSRSGSSRSSSSSSSHKIKSHSDSSRSGSSFSNGSGRRYWSFNSPAGSSTRYRRPTQEPFPSKHYFQNYRYSSRYPWDSYDAKPWNPKTPKAKLKDVAGDVVVGAAGGFLLGGSLSHMELYFWDPKEERWWYEHRDSYPDMVYFRNYDRYPAPFMAFIEDCVNVTVREFIVNQTDEMEIKVVPHVVRQMCKEEYIESILFRHSRERKPGEIAKMKNTGGAVITSIEGISASHDRVVALDISFLVMLFFLTKLLFY